MKADGFVLAGGASSRMGQDKAVMEWGGMTLVERAVGVMREACGSASICGDREDLAWLAHVVEDEVKGAGPLAGIHAGLRACGAEWGVFVAVDMPGVEAEHLRRLMERAEGEGLMASVAVDAVGRMHPLLGVYRRDLAEVLGRELAAGERAVWRVVERVCGVGLVRVEFEDAVLRNVNTPEDLGGAG